MRCWWGTITFSRSRTTPDAYRIDSHSIVGALGWPALLMLLVVHWPVRQFQNLTAEPPAGEEVAR